VTVSFAPSTARRTARIAGIGEARPSRRVPAAVLTEPFGKDAEWLRIRTGITEIHRLGTDETLLDLAIRAACDALRDAGIAPENVDLIAVASCSTDTAGTGPLAQRVASAVAPRAAAFDLNAACAGFCYALSAANAFIRSGAAHTVLVVGAEHMSRLIDPADLGTSILFGDGAGAAVVAVSENGRSGIAAPAWSSDGAQADVLEILPGETALRMRGRDVFRWAVDEVHKVASKAMANAGARPEDIDVFVPHQANLRIVEAITRRLGLQNAITAIDVVEAGNTSAASIPLALARLRRSGEARSGQLALLAGFGAGLTIAAQVVRLP
jgi:3-oxoacyl-[acyl-carrier-protein] synthase III